MTNQHKVGQWAETAGNRSDVFGNRAYRSKLNIPNQLASLRIHAGVQHHCARLDHRASKAVAMPNAGKNEIGLPGDIPQVVGVGVA